MIVGSIHGIIHRIGGGYIQGEGCIQGVIKKQGVIQRGGGMGDVSVGGSRYCRGGGWHHDWW